MKNKCVFAGSFDPPTKGHKWVVERARELFDEVTVAVMTNPAKTPCFTVEEKLKLLELTLGEIDGVKLVAFQGTAAELLKREGTNFYVRGVRGGGDFDYETADFYATKKLNDGAQAVYFPCPQELLHVSSSAARSCLTFGADCSEFLEEKAYEYARQRKTQR